MAQPKLVDASTFEIGEMKRGVCPVSLIYRESKVILAGFNIETGVLHASLQRRGRDGKFYTYSALDIFHGKPSEHRSLAEATARQPVNLLYTS
jgi:hypothetical protein